MPNGLARLRQVQQQSAQRRAALQQQAIATRQAQAQRMAGLRQRLAALEVSRANPQQRNNYLQQARQELQRRQTVSLAKPMHRKVRKMQQIISTGRRGRATLAGQPLPSRRKQAQLRLRAGGVSQFRSDIVPEKLRGWL